MVVLQKYLTRTNKIQPSNTLPLLNSLFIQNYHAFDVYGAENGYKTYMKWARRSPHLMGLLNIIATDILSDKINFEPLKRVSSGRNKVLKAEKFWNKNKGLEIVEETLYDLLITGIGYTWIGSLDVRQMKEFSEHVAEGLSEYKGFEIKAEDIYDSVVNQTDVSLAKKLRHVAASTMTKNTNEYEVIEYIQRVGVNTRRFKPKEIIEFKLMPLDGKIYPFPPLEALLAEVYLLWLISQCHLSFFENGGSPDKVFILPNEIANSKNHQYLIATLKKYKKIQNKHGNLVFTGDLKVEDLMQVENQMQNRDLSLYLTGVVAMFYGVPVSRIPFLIGRASNLGDSGGLADSGYWRKISVWQSKLEFGYNNELWNPFFGVSMKFARGYKQDEVRETATEMQKNNVAEQRLNLGLWTLEESARYLGIDPEIIIEAQNEKKKRDEETMKSGLLNQNMTNKNNALFEQDKKLKNQKKQSSQLRNTTNAGGQKINP